MGGPEAHGFPRKPSDAKNSSTQRRNRIFHGDSALELWFAVPGPLTQKGRAPTDDRGSSRGLKHIPIHHRARISHGNSAQQLSVTVPDALTWADRTPTEARGRYTYPIHT